MATVYLCDYILSNFNPELIAKAFIHSGFCEFNCSTDYDIWLENKTNGERLSISNGEIYFYPNSIYLEDIIDKTIEYRKILHKVDSRFLVYYDIKLVTFGYVDSCLFNSIVSDFRIRYKYDRYKTGRLRSRRIFWSLKYIGSNAKRGA